MLFISAVNKKDISNKISSKGLSGESHRHVLDML